MTNQLLMAAARGARIISDTGKRQKYVWVNEWEISGECRIHPDDEHLRFGPIGSALRDAAGKNLEYFEIHGLMCAAHVTFPYGTGGSVISWHYASELTRSLFLLILSEALAEEGL